MYHLLSHFFLCEEFDLFLVGIGAYLGGIFVPLLAIDPLLDATDPLLDEVDPLLEDLFSAFFGNCKEFLSFWAFSLSSFFSIGGLTASFSSSVR